MLNPTRTKQIKIVAAFVVIISFISFFVYLLITPPATCSDGKQNQGEKGIDCGGPCSPCSAKLPGSDLVTQEITFVNGGNGTYDAVAKIYNPNDAMGAQSFKYVFTLKDASGTVIATKEGSNFILPVDSKYVAELGISTKDNAIPAKVEIAISDIQWTKLGNIQKPQLGVYNKKFDKQPMGDGSQAQGTVRNESGYDLNKINLVIVLRDAAGKIIGVNVTEKNVVRANEQQDFKLNWPYALDGNVQNMEVDAQSNVLDPQDFSQVSTN